MNYLKWRKKMKFEVIVKEINGAIHIIFYCESPEKYIVVFQIGNVTKEIYLRSIVTPDYESFEDFEFLYRLKDEQKQENIHIFQENYKTYISNFIECLKKEEEETGKKLIDNKRMIYINSKRIRIIKDFVDYLKGEMI